MVEGLKYLSAIINADFSVLVLVLASVFIYE
jgi:hypothetical protein